MAMGKHGEACSANASRVYAAALCRHRNYFGVVSGCLNDGICADRDQCFCVRAPSILHEVEMTAPEGTTGYTGSDCSIGMSLSCPGANVTALMTMNHGCVCLCVPAMCVQGWYDPDCILVPPFETGVASGGEGCYRCPNGGNCTAPDFCTCTEEWQGYDCRTREWLLPCLDTCQLFAPL